MLSVKSEVADIPTINLTGQEANIRYPPSRGNIARDAQDDMNASTAAPSCSTYPHDVHDESFSSIAPSHTGSVVASAVPSTLDLQSILTASLIINKKTFSPKSIENVKSLMSKEGRVQTLITIGTEEAATCFDATTSQDEKSYDGDVSKVDEEDAQMILDEADDVQIEASKSAGDDTLPDNKGQEVANKENGEQTSKPGDKKPVQKCDNWSSSGSQDGPVSYNKTKYPRDHISVHYVQRASRVLLMNSLSMLKEGQKMSDIFFHVDITLVDSSILQGGEWPSVP